MKVLQILPELNSGGVERGTLEVASYLTHHGHEALVVSNGGRLVAELEAEGARHITMPVHRKAVSSLFQVGKIRELLVKEKPDIVHIRSRVPGWITWLAWRGMEPKTRPRFVSTVHGFYSVNRYSAVMMKGERVIAVSESIKKYILKNYPDTPEKIITVIHRGVSPDQFPRDYQPDPSWLEKWNAEQPQLEGKKVLLLPGRITRWKGQEDFIKLIAGLRKERVNAHGLIVGETSPKKRGFEAELRELARELEVGENVSFLGHRNDMKEILSISDITYSLSRDPEAFGRVSLEALSIGKPVVAYAHGGVEEQLRRIFPEGLVQPCDVLCAVDRSIRILEKSDNLESIEDFTLERMLSSTMKVYEDVLSDARRPK